MIATRPSRARETKEEKILAAATELFLEQGYDATSMDQVAARAHASKTTLYTRFPSKEALFKAVIANKCEQSGLHFEPTEFAGASVDDALIEIGGRFLGLICSPEALRVEQVVMSEAPRFPEIAAAYEQEGPERVTQAVTGFFEQAQKSGLIDVPDPRFGAEQFLNALKGPCMHDIVLRQRPALNAEEQARFVEQVVWMFLNGARRRP